MLIYIINDQNEKVIKTDLIITDEIVNIIDNNIDNILSDIDDEEFAHDLSMYLEEISETFSKLNSISMFTKVITIKLDYMLLVSLHHILGCFKGFPKYLNNFKKRVKSTVTV